MASHNEIKPGDTCWVVRIAGEDVRVKVMEKNPKASGRGFEFRVRRIGAGGRVEGRNLTRGSGALRKPGTPVKAFGGKASAPKSKKAAPKKKANPFAAPRAEPKPLRRSSPTPSTRAKPEAPLGSLRGRGRPSRPTSTVPKKVAPAKKGKETLQFRVPNDLIKKVMRRLEKLDKTADTYHVRNEVAAVLAEHERSKYAYGTFGR
jgi:hypothetical protein